MKRAGKSLAIPFLFAAAAACAAGAEAPPAQHWHWNYPCEIFTGAIILGILLAGALSAIVFLLYRRKYNRITLNVHRALPVRGHGLRPGRDDPVLSPGTGLSQRLPGERLQTSE